MSCGRGIAAHLIIGPREEPFLSAMLDSIGGTATLLIVNDNAGEPSPHTATLAASRFGKEDRIVVDRTPFSNFAAARNICLDLHAKCNAGPWVAFVDADEVHGEGVRRIAQHLTELPKDFDFVDGYTWHFFASFDYYTSIERRMMFFRYRPNLRWEGAVHERLLGSSGRHIALPYVYAHYGHTLEPRRHAEKGRHYSSLGAPGNVLREDQLEDFDVVEYFRPVYPRLLRFSGMHPRAATATLHRLRGALRGHHDATERVISAESRGARLRGYVRKLTYEFRWRSRALNPLARRMVG